MYRTTCTENGKVYVGVHKTERLDDGYLGSGRLLRLAVRKYGRDAFQKDILFVFDNEKDMLEKESELVTRSYLERSDVYNLIPGGAPTIQALPEKLSEWGRRGSAASQKAQKGLMETSPSFREMRRQNGANLRKRMREEGREGVLDPNAFKGRKHSPETLQKMKDAKKGRYEGEKNPVFGTAWVRVPGVREKRVLASEVPLYLEQGWEKGRFLFRE